MDTKLPVLSLQEVFNKAYAHALTMDKKCTTSDFGHEMCSYYKEENGKVSMCLIGAVLGPEVAKQVANDKEYFGQSAGGLNYGKYRFCSTVRGPVDLLQSCHDNILSEEPNFNELLMGNLKNYAEIQRLTIPDVQAS